MRSGGRCRKRELNCEALRAELGLGYLRNSEVADGLGGASTGDRTGIRSARSQVIQGPDGHLKIVGFHSDEHQFHGESP